MLDRACGNMLIGTGVMAVTLQGLCGAQGTVHTSEGCPKGPVTLLSVGPRDGSFTPHLTSRVRTRTTAAPVSQYMYQHLASQL